MCDLGHMGKSSHQNTERSKNKFSKFSYKILGKKCFIPPSPPRNLFLVNPEMGVKYFIESKYRLYYIKRKYIKRKAIYR